MKKLLAGGVFIAIVAILLVVARFSSVTNNSPQIIADLADSAISLDCNAPEPSLTAQTYDHHHEFIQVHYRDRVPNFVHQPTIHTVKSGRWSDESVWSEGRLPQDQDIVLVDVSHVIEYDVDDGARLQAVGVAGQLRFANDRNTRLAVTHMLVFRTGRLQIGTPQQPLHNQHLAEIVINDVPLMTGSEESPGADPWQYGNGLLVWGELALYGSPKATPFVRLANSVAAGDKILQLVEVPDSWRQGDGLLLPDSRQIAQSQVGLVDKAPYNQPGSAGIVLEPQWELVEIQAIDGNQVYLQSAAQFTHRSSATTGFAEQSVFPHAANISRNIVIRSESANGVRGHTVGFHRAKLAIHNVLFKDLGRTTISPVDETRLASDGSLEYIGANPLARYPVHMHHLTDPLAVFNGDASFELVGSVVWGAKRWGVSIHGSHFGLIKDNIVFDLDGAGIVTEDGSETGNVFDGNFVAAVRGSGLALDARRRGEGVGHEGSGFWFGSDNNIVINNVSAGVRNSGFALFRTEGSANFPAFPSLTGVADYKKDGRIFRFDNNEAYGSAGSGIRIWSTKECKVCKAHPVTLDNSLVWHSANGVTFDYHADYYTIENMQVLGDPDIVDATVGVRANHSRVAHVKSVLVKGMQIAVEAGGVRNRKFKLEQSHLQTPVGVQVMMPTSWGGERWFVLDGVKFDQTESERFVEFIPAAYDSREGRLGKKAAKRPVYIYNHQQISGDDYQVFRPDQAPDYTIPQSDDPAVGCPQAGLTNQQCFDQHQIALGGQIATCDTRLKGVQGFTCRLNTNN